LSAEHVGELVREIAPLLAGLTLREVVARPPRDLLLNFADPGDELGPPAWRVLVSGDQDAPRLHVQRGRFERHEGPLGPFFMRMQKELTGTTFRSLTQISGDRIVAFELRGDETRTLVAELVGRHSNLVLLGPGERVIDVLVAAPSTQDNPRLAAGKPYAPPPGRALKNTSTESTIAVAFPAPSAEPTLRRHETANPAPASWIVENALGDQAEEARIARERREIVERLERKAKNARSLVHGLSARLTASRDVERLQQDGELVKANLSRIPRGAKSIEVDDFFDAETKPRKIVLDPKLSPHENLERIFERAKKLERSGAMVEEELALARAKLARLEDFIARANTDGADFEALGLEAANTGVLEEKQIAEPKRREAQSPRVPYKTFHGVDGSEIRVGRNARDNDDLTFRHASGNDLWFHTADTPGSHVILRLKTHEPHPEAVLDAAHLAVQFSPLAGARAAKVHFARRKEVHKPRGAKPGLVTLSGGKILDVRMQPERLTRLLGTHRPPQPGS